MNNNKGKYSAYNPDHGPEPYIFNISKTSAQNRNYRTTVWTGKDLQQTLMCICDEVGLEIHPDNDQFIRIEEGCGRAMMGKTKNNLNYKCDVSKGCVIFVPAGTWHNFVNCGRSPLKLSSIYAPPHHPHGTVHRTKEDADREEKY